jgi:membrane protein YqaA with SNARE-associated domain
MRSVTAGTASAFSLKNPTIGCSAGGRSCVLSSVILAVQAAARHAHHHRVLGWVLHFGLAGVFGVSLLDASPIPLPIPGSTDLLILILGAHGENPWLLAPAAILGSLIGAWFTWTAGKKGGEAMLDRYLSRKLRNRICRWIHSHGILTVTIAAMLPPPIPLLPFLLAAGALGVTRRQLFTALGIARTLRYGSEAALALIFGHQILRWVNRYLAGSSSTILYTFLSLLAAAIVFGVWKYRHDRRRAAQPAEHTQAV